MELQLAPPAMQHCPPQRPNSLKRLLRTPPLVVYRNVLQHRSDQVLYVRSPTHARCRWETLDLTQHLPQPPEHVTAQERGRASNTMPPGELPFWDHTPMRRSAYCNRVPASRCSEQTLAPSSSSALDGLAAHPIVANPMGMNCACHCVTMASRTKGDPKRCGPHDPCGIWPRSGESKGGGRVLVRMPTGSRR